ncbi:MAG: TerB family tellurite resistance protein [Gammaproteobacteria bacterium]
MIEKLARRLSDFLTSEAAVDQPGPDKVHFAAACLLVEVMAADFDKADTEREAIVRALTGRYGLGEAAARELLAEAEAEHRDSVSSYSTVSVITENLGRGERVGVIEALWEVAYADGVLDQYEEATVRKVADLLFVDHPDFIRAKLRAEKRAGALKKGN